MKIELNLIVIIVIIFSPSTILSYLSLYIYLSVNFHPSLPPTSTSLSLSQGTYVLRVSAEDQDRMIDDDMVYSFSSSEPFLMTD